RCQFLSDGLRNPFGSYNRSPLREHDVDALFAKRRNVRQITMPPGIGDREGAHLAGADLRKELSGIKKTPVGMTPEHGEQRRATAIVRDVVVLNPRCPSNHSHWEIPRSPRPGVSKVKLSRILFLVFNPLADGFQGPCRR